LVCSSTPSNPSNRAGEPSTLSDGSNGAFASRHPGGANFAFGDGHVEFLDENVSLFVYRSLATRSNGEVVDRED
jgi:prepilin-type processing-associated H-X9-DG protein